MIVVDEERKYSLGEADYIVGSKDFTILHRRKFGIKHLGRQGGMDASLWNVSFPRWPGSSKSKIGVDKAKKMLKKMYGRSQATSHMVLWMPARELHRSDLDPLEDLDPWLPMATIFSGSLKRLEIGFVYAKGRSTVNWDNIIIPDDRGKCGSASSHAMKFIVERLQIKEPYYDMRKIVEPFAHADGQLALWSRLLGVHYVGYTSSKTNFKKVKGKLAQMNLPGIQIELPAAE